MNSARHGYAQLCLQNMHRNTNSQHRYCGPTPVPGRRFSAAYLQAVKIPEIAEILLFHRGDQQVWALRRTFSLLPVITIISIFLSYKLDIDN